MDIRQRINTRLDNACLSIDNSLMSETVILCERVERIGDEMVVAFREPSGNAITFAIGWPLGRELGWPPAVGGWFVLTRHAPDRWSIEELVEVTYASH